MGKRKPLHQQNQPPGYMGLLGKLYRVEKLPEEKPVKEKKELPEGKP